MKITPAKGRPMLTWVGKRPLSHVTAFPAQHVETFDPAGTLREPSTSDLWKDWPSQYPPGGLLFHGDNEEVLAHLLANGFRGRVQLIYIDPPFDSGANYVRRVNLRGPQATVKLDGEGYTLGEQIQYTDIWANDNYLQFMYERCLLLKELVAADGFLFVHLDSDRVHYLRIILDEIFGETNYLNEIIWQGTSAHNDPGRFGKIHNNLLLYGKSGPENLKTKLGERSQSYVERWFRFALGPAGDVITLKPGEALPSGYRRFRLSDLRSPHPRPNLMYKFKGYEPHPNGWAVTIERMEEYDRQGRLHYPSSLEGRIQLRNFLDEMDAPTIQDIWWDIVAEANDEDLLEAEAVTDTWRGVRTLQGKSREATGYPTQKPESLLERIVLTSSDEGDIVLDCFVGSGTTAAVAQKHGRRWIVCDINKGAIQTASGRLQNVIRAQLAASGQSQLNGQIAKNGATFVPPQLAFTVWRVNDYDLTIQHNEAVSLACEHIGVERIRTDSYFDGTLGKALVKMIPFDHPLSPIDLEELRRELEARPDEDRNVVLVCLGIELAARAWIDDWNRLRRGKSAINRVEFIELRTDPKYGKFFKHEPARAKVKFARRQDRVLVEIEDFISPTIIERLQQQAGILQPKIDDWRAMVDSVAIDTAYDGQVFNIVLSDVPERKIDLVSGRYDLPAPPEETNVAVKITDMLGEEVLVIQMI